MPPEALTIIGARIRARRKAIKGLSLIKLGSLLEPYNLGLDHSDLSKIERGERRLKLEALPYLCKVLRCSYADVLGDIPA